MESIDEARRTRLAQNLDAARRRIDEAARRAGRDPREITLVAVTKGRHESYVPALLALGVRAIGENRPEEIVRKQQLLGIDVPWHMIGHFQRKKINRSLPHMRAIHSVHSLELLSILEVRALQDPEVEKPLPFFLQVNVSGEESKQGFPAADVPDVADLSGGLRGLVLRGLMTMAPADSTESEARWVFRRMRDIADSLGRERVPDLSMGMSADFEIAIEEGATLVRLGSVLFDGLEDEG